MRSVVVVGAGVIGLSCALVLSERGWSVTVISRDDVGSASVDGSASVAAASLWAPTLVERSERVRQWAYVTLAELRRIAAAEPEAGIREQAALTLGEAAWTPDPWMRGFGGPVRDARADELPVGYGAGAVSVVPLIDTARYLPWLHARCRRSEVEVVHRDARSPADAAPDLMHGTPVVIAAGFGSGALVDDPSLTSVRGQIVRMTNPGLTRTVMVRDGALGPLFVVPRFDDVVIGGPSQAESSDIGFDEGLERDLVTRARAIAPALDDATVLGRAVGLRPVRPTVRVERERIGETDVVHCYGHGGAGYALSWGTAVAAADLVEQIG
ncbi:NAD(P)/FAD-dependent oxidoreductase [Microbacterium rhizomatis]|uniref:NAD(P)/FAD-dependent oxidoreductase n=1 Tax=Microbacterium rhizomatis TaxID=1631477 RepID=UPI0014787EA8|nr:FAD-dependent oxidoreductase [Microbacterium rhizomatis]